MDRRWLGWLCAGAVVAGCGGQIDNTASTDSELGGGSRLVLLVSRDDTGTLGTLADGKAAQVLRGDPTQHPFFQSLGTNGRACISCHVPSAGWTISPEAVQLRFTNPLDPHSRACLLDPTRCPAEHDPAKFGLDPLFRTVDGSNSPKADVSTTYARLDAYSMLLTKAVIRVGIGIPDGAEFSLAAVDDPYGYASAKELSLFRRPLPATNLATAVDDTATLSSVMWDGRETLAGHTIFDDLADQANSATLGHAQAKMPLDDATRGKIVDFETHLHTAQMFDEEAGDLGSRGAHGGPFALAQQIFYAGINDVLAGDPKTHKPFDKDAMTLYDAWAGQHDDDKAAVARGQKLFDEKPIAIKGVGGLNDALGQPVIPGFCTTCHDSPNYGHHSLPLPINIGTADGARRTPDLPLYTLKNNATGETVQTTDPGRALISGKWKDIGKFKGPILRGLAGRAPYFHNGAAASLRDVVEFYDGRFGIGFTEEEKEDLVAFLRTL